jgi:transposase-like zinc-binding protein
MPMKPTTAACTRSTIDSSVHHLSRAQGRAMRDIELCRTAALGGHRERCDRCGAERISYNSCRNRHCPKCQTLAKERWLDARRAELLPVEYFHVVFTLPHALYDLLDGNARLIYSLLFHTTAATLHTFARDPAHLGGELGVTAVLHTWGQTLTQHIHCIASSPAAP